MPNTQLGIIKVCGDPHCEAIYHNCPKKVTHCNDCDGRLIQINEETFWKKYSDNYIQYDQPSGEYYRPIKQEQQLSLQFN